MSWTETLKDIYDRSSKLQRWFILLIIPIIAIIFLLFNNIDTVMDGFTMTRKEHYQLIMKDSIDSVRRSMWQRFRHQRDSLNGIINYQNHIIDSLKKDTNTVN